MHAVWNFFRSAMYYSMSCNSNVFREASNNNVGWNTDHRHIADRQNSLKGRNEQKCLLYIGSVEKLNKLVDNYFSDKISGDKINNIVVDRITVTNFGYCDVKFFKKWTNNKNM